VTAALHGSTGRAFAARRGDEAVFVKLGTAHATQRRLAALGVTPALLAQGPRYTISRYVEGVVPDRIWMRDNTGAVIDLLTVVQRDDPLRNLLTATAPVPPLAEHLATVIARLIERTMLASTPAFRSSEIEMALERLRSARHAVTGVPLVPSHTDPNNSNVLVSPDRVYLIDWDGITLSDPLRDIALLLWWYVPPERWGAMLQRFWLPDAASATTIDRVFWWAAVSSLRIALWIERQTPDDDAIQSFLADFIAAAHGRPNPKGLTP
jgi:aminoglycoside phosphotransferase (APT) family kinase protein